MAKRTTYLAWLTTTPSRALEAVTEWIPAHPQQLTTTLTAIGLTAAHADVPDSPGGDDG